MSQKQQYILPDDLLDRVVRLGEKAHTLHIQIETVHAAQDEWLNIGSTYVAKCKAVTKAKDDLEKFKVKFLEEPNIADIMATLAGLRDMAADVVDTDPVWAEIKSMDSSIQYLLNDAYAPYRKAIDDAENAKREYANWMLEPDQQLLKKSAERVVVQS